MKMLLQSDDQRELYGIDLSEKMLSVAEGKLSSKVQLVLGDSEHLPFADNFFDVVYCNDSFHRLSGSGECHSRSPKSFKTGRYIFDWRLLAALGWTRDYEFLYAP